MSQARNLAGFAQTANTSGFVANTQIAGLITTSQIATVSNTQITGVVANSAAVFTSSGFRVIEANGKLTFKFGATTIGTLDSSGNFLVIGNVGAFSPSP